MIIGLTGKRLSGKDTAGAFLVEHHDFERIAFADALKEAVAALFDITREEVDEFKSDRGGSLPFVEVHLDIGGEFRKTFGWVEFLQRFGTEMGRKTWGWDFWVDRAFPHRVIDSLDDRNIVVTDVRFDNEAQRIRDLGGYIVQLIRPVDDPHGKHESEDGISPDLVDYVIENTQTIEHLHECLLGVLEDIDANGR